MPSLTLRSSLLRSLAGLGGLAAVIACGPAVHPAPPPTPSAAPQLIPASFWQLLTVVTLAPAPAATHIEPSAVAAVGPNPAAPAAPLAPAPTAIAVRRGDGGRPLVALTFDMDSVAGYTAQILDILSQNGVKATFAVTGVWAKAQPTLLKRIFNEGHLIINHSWDHPAFTKLTREQRQQELEMTDSLIQSLVGVSTKPYFRPPYGDYNASVLADVREVGYRYNVMWSVDPQGWRGFSSQRIVAAVFANVRDGGIVLFHVAAYGDYAALPQIIDGLRQAGYGFVTVAQLLGEAPISAPTPTATLAATPIATPTATPTQAPSSTPTPTSTPTPAVTPSGSPSTTPTATSAATPTVTSAAAATTAPAP